MIRRSLACLTFLAAPAFLLASCGEDDKAGDDRTAQGEILEGTISDEMLPLDTVTSQPPLAKEAVKAAASEGAESEAAEDAASLDAQQPAVENAVE